MKNNLNISTTTFQILFKLLYVITFNRANCKTYNKSEKTKYEQSEVNFIIKYYQDYA